MAEERDLFKGVNKAKSGNPDDMSDLEKKHVPVITAPDSVKAGEWFDVTIEVGKLKDHPNEKKHYIEFVDLYAGDVYLTRMDFTPEMSAPTLTTRICLKADVGPLRAFERCNMHGIWEGDKAISVT